MSFPSEAAVQKLESASELMRRFQDTDAAVEAHYNLGLCHSAPRPYLIIL